SQSHLRSSAPSRVQRELRAATPGRNARAGLSPHSLPAPGFDLRVVAREQNVRNLPAAELRGPCVVRVLEAAAELLREALELARSFGERTRQPSCHGVEQDHCG